jgi:peptidoglycan/xylan/chitin deacetylase (PgdA/CDA1 family)
MRHFFLVIALVVLAVTSAFADSASPVLKGRHEPPPPRDGQGMDTVVTPVLIYHSVRPYIETDTPAIRRYVATPETLEKELAWLKENGYVSVTMEDLASRLAKGTSLPPKPVVITFDDNWQSQYTYAVPLLKKYGFTATFYIWVSVVGLKNHMTWDEVRALGAAGMQVGCHTWTHPYLTKIKDDAVLAHEIAGSKQRIETEVGRPVTALAYPFGQYDERVAAAARAAGFTTARSTWPGVVHSVDGLYSLTGLIRTESTTSLVDAMKRYLDMASLSSEGAADILGLDGGPGDISPLPEDLPPIAP